VRNRNDGIGVYILVIFTVLACGAAATFGAGRIYRPIHDAATGLASRPPYVPAPDPIARAEAGLSPNSTDIDPGEPDPAIRTVQVFPNVIYTVAGGRILRTIPLRQQVHSLLEIIDRVGDPGWISNDGGAVTLKAALILEAHTDITIAAPLYKVTMLARPGVYIGASGSHLTIKATTVTASDSNVPKEGQVGDPGRPFVVASDAARMDIANSHFLYLGRDWNASYGVSWVRGSTGSATESIFEKSLIGVFTAGVRDITFLKNTFRDNTLYGLDPHTSSTGLTIDQNLAEGNGHHGIIFSDHVTQSVVRYNVCRDNGVNGIMMDFASDQNLIMGNRAEGNKGDGIVMSDSSENTVTGNTIDNNRAGVHVYGKILSPDIFTDNKIENNVVAAQGAQLGAGNVLRANGNHWVSWVVVFIWVAVVVAGALLCLLTWWSRRRRVSRVIADNDQVARARARTGAV
jgi:poly(beta-D-mannuronate) C5 epimerase